MGDVMENYQNSANGARNAENARIEHENAHIGCEKTKCPIWVEMSDNIANASIALLKALGI